MRNVILAISLAACTGIIDGPVVTDEAIGSVDPWDELERIKREGPPRYTSRVRSCPKMRYRTIGNVLASRGVDLSAPGDVAAGTIWRTGAAALGAPNYASRTRETIDLGLATTSKLFDIYVQAAPEIIANMGSRAACPGARLFDDAGRCDWQGVSCLLGVPATPTHLAICNTTIARAPDVTSGQQLAVAVLASAAHTCE